MANVALLALCLVVGIVARLTRRVPENAVATVNGFIVYVALPAVILEYVHATQPRAALLGAVLMPWLFFAIGAALFWVAARALRMKPQTAGVMMMVGGLGNTSFVGLPMIDSFFGPQFLSIGILIDQLGSYLVLGTFGIAITCYYAAGRASPRQILMRIITFPPLIAMTAALVLIPVPFPAWLLVTLHRLGDTLAPLALISIGLQLRWAAPAGNLAAVAIALGYKLVLGPALIALIYVGLVGGDRDILRVTVLEAAMPPAVGASIVAMEYGLDRELIALIVGAGTVLAFVTLPLWYLVLARL